MARRPSVRTLLKDLDAAELREVIAELCKLSPKNRQFLELHVQGSEAAAPESVVEDAEKKIHARIYGRGQFPKTDLAGARKVVSEYSKVLKAYPHHAMGLKLYFVELGTDITAEFGDMYEGFYNSLESMFEAFCTDVREHPSSYAAYQDRIRALRRQTSGMGWGYGDEIEWLASELAEEVEQQDDGGEESA